MNRMHGERDLRYSIRKLSVGVCGVLVGAFLLGGPSLVQADEVSDVSTQVSSELVAASPEAAESAPVVAEASDTLSNVTTDPALQAAETRAVASPEAAAPVTPESTSTTPVAEESSPAPAESPAQTQPSVDDYLADLDYDKTAVLTQQGETISNAPTTAKQQENGEFVVVEKTKKSLTKGTSDISVNGNSDVYVGALLKADQGLLENQPTLVSLPRATGTISVDLPGMTGGNSRIEVVPTASKVQDAVNTLVERWNKTYASDHATPARMQYESVSAYSMNQLKATFGIDFEKIGAPLKLDLEAVHKGEKQIEVVNFKQIYYTASFDAPENPSDVFAAGVTADHLKKRGLTAQTPPVYVSSVSYGRQMYVSFETTSKSTELKAAIGALIEGVSISPGTEWARVLKDVTVRAVIIGGNAEGAARVVTGDIDTLKALIREGASFSPQSPAVPVSYKTAFLKDNSPATITNTTDYVETKVTAYQKGYLNIHHKGAYIARYTITWDEVSYDQDGKEIIVSKSWQDNGKPRTAGFKTQLQFGGNVRNLRVQVEERTGLAWEPWRTVYNQTGLPLVQNRTITHSGTTLNPKVKEDIVNA